MAEAGTSGRDWMFCPRTGTLLELDTANNAAVCPLCDYRRSLDVLQHIRVVSRTDMEDYRRRYKLEPLVKTSEAEEDVKRQRAIVDDEICPKCGAKGMEFYTMQLRSADEGQTVFYECRNKACKHKYSVNT